MRRASSAHVGVQRAHRQLHRDGFGNDVERLAGLHAADRDHGRMLRVDLACDDRLQRDHDAARGRHRIAREMRHRAVADPAQRDRHAIGRRHRGAGAEGHVAGRAARHVVDCEDRVAREAVEQAVVHHCLRAAEVFFGRLEDQVQRAGELARGCEWRAARWHRGVAVVAACMHLVRVAARVRQAVVSASGSASMSARSPTVRVPCPSRSTPTTPSCRCRDALHNPSRRAARRRDRS